MPKEITIVYLNLLLFILPFASFIIIQLYFIINLSSQ